MNMKSNPLGFSLVELLIALSLLGVITAFTIPKLFDTPDSTLARKQTTQARNAAFMVLNAYQQYQNANGTVATNTTLSLLTPYMNYVSVTSSGSMDDHPPSNALYTCGGNSTCLKLHSGGTVFFPNSYHFGGNATTNGTVFFFDPDSVRTGSSSDGPGKALCVCFFITMVP